MTVPDKPQQLYEELANQYRTKGDARQRDIFLMLAADVALSQGQPHEAERLRRRLLEISPHNLLRPFANLEEALRSNDILDYVRDLRGQFPPAKAAKMLEQMREQNVGSALAGSFSEENASPPPSSLWEGKPPKEPAPAPPKSSRPIRSEAVLADMLKQPAQAPIPLVPASPLPAKARRKSPYENPDYGPKVPLATPPREFTGNWIVFLLAALIALSGLALAGYVFWRPFLR